MTTVFKTILVLVLSVAAIGQTQEFSADTQKQNSLLDNKLLDNVDIKQKQEILKAFETSLLTLFNLKTRPRPRKDIKIPQYMIDLYKSHTSDPESLSHNFKIRGKGVGSANTVRSFYHHNEADDVIHMSGCDVENCAKVLFNVTHIPMDETLTAAELRVYIDQDVSAIDSDKKKKRRLRMEVHQVLKPPKNGYESITRLIDVKHVSARKNASWASFDVHPAVLQWKNTPNANYGLEIRILPYNNNPSKLPIKHVRLRRSTSLSEKDWHSQRPLLVTYSDDNRDKLVRTKRSKKNKRRKQRRNRRRRAKRHCKRKPLYVDFSAVGWTDWIFAPPGYQAYYCHGECEFPFSEHMNATNHAIVQDLVNSVDPKSVPKPCCVPTELSPISLLYVDEYDKVILKSYQDMVVEGCGCR